MYSYIYIYIHAKRFYAYFFILYLKTNDRNHPININLLRLSMQLVIKSDQQINNIQKQRLHLQHPTCIQDRKNDYQKLD
jgi:hypothetical protein